MKKILNKYYAIPLPAKSTIWFLITDILQKVISFITIPLFTRLLTTEEFGQVTIYQSWISIITIFATLSLWGGVFNNGMLKFEEDRERFLSSLQGLSTTITMILLIVSLLFKDIIIKIINIPSYLIILMFFQINFSTPINLWAAKQKYEFTYKKLVITTLILILSNPIAGLVFVFISSNRGIARIVSIAAVQIIVGLVLYIRNIIFGKSFFEKKYWEFALSFNLPLIPHYLSQTILNHSDRIMINNLVGADKAGIYSIAYSVGMLFLFIVTSINSAFIPWTYRQLKSKSYNKVGKLSYFILILISAVVFLLISFAPEIISIMAPPEYQEAIWIVPPIALSIYFIFLYGIFVNIEFYYEENKFIMFASVIVAILNILLNIVFIPLFGYMAAGYTTLICYILYSLSHYVFMNKVLLKYNINDRIYFINKIVLLSVILISSSFLITLTYEMLLIRFLIVMIVVTAFFINKKKIKKMLISFRSN